LFFGLFYLIALAGTLPKWPRITWLIPLVWLCLTVMRIRNGPLFAITAVIALGDMYPQIRWRKWLIEHGSELLRITPVRTTGKRFDWRPVLIPALLVMTSVTFQLAKIPFPVIGHGWVRLERTRFPVELLPQLRKYEQEGRNQARIFNDMSFGGFLIYYTPGLRVFIDDRCELYGDKGLIAYAQAMQNPAQIDQWARQYGFEIALVEKESAFDRYLDSTREWIKMRQTVSASLYRRRHINE
jgi:hypothetical protein